MIQCYISAFVIIPIGEGQAQMEIRRMQDQKDGLDYAGQKKRKD
jgi:hypothetical protein